ncbi:MAG: leucine--tRNA ligase [Candidatus Paceibacterota bacterium]
MKEYDHKSIEKKWQQRWADDELYKTPESPENPHYILDMFPYPSGSGLHVGHVEGYTGTDVYSRFQRMQGKDVLHPMGWDAFGLPAENYAIKTGVHPREKTDESIATFKEQINRLGLSYDWDREIDTSRGDYYRWTQWLFTQLFAHDLAEKKPAKVNWCPGCQTVLANEQVVDGACDRCDSHVVQKEMNQWFFRITDYADELVDDLENLDWPESTKQSQRNWIGRQEGARFTFAVNGGGTDPKSSSSEDDRAGLEVFTTRPDTLFGVTFMAVAPEHELVASLLENQESGIKNHDEVEKYVEEAEAKTDRQRQENKEKTGVQLDGVTAVHPATGDEIPIYVADYVLAGYGTGAIMAVPAHDKRDHAFAEKYDIDIKVVVIDNEIAKASDRSEGIEGTTTDSLSGKKPKEIFTDKGVIIHPDTFNGLSSDEGGEIITEKFGQKETTYRLRDWSVGRQRLWGCPIPVVYDPDGKAHAVPEEHLPWTLPDDVPFEPTGEAPLEKSAELKKRTEDIFGEGWTPETSTLDTFVDSSWYFLRFTDPHNDTTFADEKVIQDWCPVDTYVGGAEHSVMHLLYARFITKALADMNHIEFREPFISLHHQGMIMAEDGTKMSKSKENVVNPNRVVDQVGADTLRMYELFAGPFGDEVDWNTDAIAGPRRFLEKVWRLAHQQEENIKDTATPVDDHVLHQTVKAVTKSVADFRFNTAISSLMELVNDLQDRETVSADVLGILLRLLAPFAPHITEELWQKLGEEGSVHLQDWPTYDEEATREAEVNIAIQVNGTVRGEMVVSQDAGEASIISQAKEHDNVSNWLEDKAINREIYVENRLVNFVTD